MRTFL